MSSLHRLAALLQAPESNIRVVSRHKGALRWLRTYLQGLLPVGWQVHHHNLDPASGQAQYLYCKWVDSTVDDEGLPLGDTQPDVTGAQVFVVSGDATPRDVAGNVVIGNAPLWLACMAESVYAIEFSGEAPRGAEYTEAAMTAAGARLNGYTVRSL